MAINDAGLMQATRGTVFTAPAKTALPDDLSAFILNADNIKVGTGENAPVWTNTGHSANGSKPTFNKDGGDTSSLDTWLKEGVKTTVAATKWSVAITSVQADKKSLQETTGGWAGANNKGIVVPSTPTTQHKALVVLCYDSADKLSFAVYSPEADQVFDNINMSGDEFIEFSYNATFKSTDVLPKGPNGENGMFLLLSPEDFK
ncbi:hypothetical protein [Bifidobacterium olomucense]|uniref:Phage tail protein n=1 Tax=Bifidobacterium olomucense TaxID=2675324 RepID=A0A7Y0EZC7_9BIFI|nr:hypothetical protein [Bifidobacterium sp. DSM 109959]NMM98156.1 hypothetical protein [Bifidobacterium sp. DSM 109959]